MSPYREPVVVETGRIVWQEWICESKAKGLCTDRDQVADAVSSRYRGTI